MTYPYETFFCDETKETLESGDFSKTDNDVLFCMLDDLAQIMANKSSEEWAKDNSKEHKAFRKVVKEIETRLNGGNK